MGGRGASSGVSLKGKVYGSEYHSVYQSGNIKFIKQNENTSISSPMETMTKGRIYVTLGKDDQPRNITYYDNSGKRIKQIDIKGPEHKINGVRTLPHTHKGYIHDEKGTKNLSPKEKKMVERVLKTWNNKLR
jgi:hypothetical protein